MTPLDIRDAAADCFVAFDQDDTRRPAPGLLEQMRCQRRTGESAADDSDRTKQCQGGGMELNVGRIETNSALVLASRPYASTDCRSQPWPLLRRDPITIARLAKYFCAFAQPPTVRLQAKPGAKRKSRMPLNEYLNVKCALNIQLSGTTPLESAAWQMALMASPPPLWKRINRMARIVGDTA